MYCADISECSPISPREYGIALEQTTIDDALRIVNETPRLEKILTESKRNIFLKWGIDSNRPLNSEISFPKGVIVKYDNGTYDMALNTQLAKEILENANGEPALIELGENVLRLADFGNKIENEYRHRFERTFNNENTKTNHQWHECYHVGKSNDLKILCTAIDKKVSEEYFGIDNFEYILPINQFNPSLVNSTSQIWSNSNNGLKETANQFLYECLKNNKFGDLSINSSSRSCNVESSLEVFSLQLNEDMILLKNNVHKYFDILRIEAIRELFLNYTNALGNLPDRQLLKKCEIPYGHSLDNIYELTPIEFNPAINNHSRSQELIIKRNRDMIQATSGLAERIKSIYEVEQLKCRHVRDIDQLSVICEDTEIWIKNRPIYQELNKKLFKLLSEFPLLGSRIDLNDEKLYQQVLDPKGSFVELQSKSDEDLYKERDLIIKTNLVDAINRFCGKNKPDITTTDLINMPTLRKAALENFPSFVMGRIDACLEINNQLREENDQTKNITFMIGCAGLSIAAGIATILEGGLGGVALATGLGCFGLETSAMYNNYILSKVHRDNIKSCMISSPDLTQKDVYRICDSASWAKAKKRYEEAASDLKLQLILSPLEIFSAAADISTLRKLKSPTQTLLKQRDEILNQIEDASIINNLEEVNKLKHSLTNISDIITKEGVTGEDLALFYQSKVLTEATDSIPKKHIQDLPTPVTNDIIEDLPATIPGELSLSQPNNKIAHKQNNSEIILNNKSSNNSLPNRNVFSDIKSSTAVTDDMPTGYIDQIVNNIPNKMGIKLTTYFEKKFAGTLNLQEVKFLRSLDVPTLARLKAIYNLGGDYEILARKLLSSTVKRGAGLKMLMKNEVSNIAKNISLFVKDNKVAADNFIKFITNKDVTNHTISTFITNCTSRNDCSSIATALKERLSNVKQGSKEMQLFNMSPGPYMEFYIPYAKKEPLGDFIGQGGYGSVFCRASTGGCDEIIKIPLDYHNDYIYRYERELSELYSSNGERAARITSDKKMVIMTKEFIPGEEASNILFSGKNYTDEQIDDLVNLYFDFEQSFLKNRDVVYADIKANNFKWSSSSNKWVMVDTGIRPVARNPFKNPNDFYQTFGKEFFFPSWVTQTPEQLSRRLNQWKITCQKIITKLVGARKAQFAPICLKTP